MQAYSSKDNQGTVEQMRKPIKLFQQCKSIGQTTGDCHTDVMLEGSEDQRQSVPETWV